ncbi:hypothetical protein DICSQDRAFT_176175 [Dichomitus squalens LYAD-421 SS1]|uniref:Uncharacterized protein n=2 Tax=Dichomitus squalens TaxID=114155 RepID=A0A4Q9PFZ9_9APHY|nr:uncharacterized protein DICSQDRAFT_176175 [Dichomitus squalens LYAD-421 SS1]EJF55267.1 hypothetical protein DICSQDRAFT_176175 [Dichomitus squalens LYAD-421 SS1]TBU51962.1 hypothetical protein BD310DRAFT_833206 [Dichomitus squalens]
MGAPRQRCIAKGNKQLGMFWVTPNVGRLHRVVGHGFPKLYSRRVAASWYLTGTPGIRPGSHHLPNPPEHRTTFDVELAARNTSTSLPSRGSRTAAYAGHCPDPSSSTASSSAPSGRTSSLLLLPVFATTVIAAHQFELCIWLLATLCFAPLTAVLVPVMVRLGLRWMENRSPPTQKAQQLPAQASYRGPSRKARAAFTTLHFLSEIVYRASILATEVARASRFTSKHHRAGGFPIAHGS